MRTFADALSGLEAEWVRTPDGCQAKKPWSRGMLSCQLEGVGGHDCVESRGSVLATMFTECLRDSLQEASLERWTHVGCAGQVCGAKSARRELSPWRAARHLMKDDLVWGS